MVSRSAFPCGIDVERTDRQRPAAFRAASRWCASPIRSARQWTQAEAIWKATRPGPLLGVDLIPIPFATGSGWQLSADASWWVHSSESNGGYVWSLAVSRRSRAMLSGEWGALPAHLTHG